MKQISFRTFHGFVLFALVLAYFGIIFKLFDTGWLYNVTTTTLLITIMLLVGAAMFIWNLIVNFIDSKKETKK